MPTKLLTPLLLSLLIAALALPAAALAEPTAQAANASASAKAKSKKAQRQAAKRQHRKAHRRNAERRRAAKRAQRQARAAQSKISSAQVVQPRPAAPAPAPQPPAAPAAPVTPDFFSGHSIADFDVEHAAPGALSEPGSIDGSSSAIQMTVGDGDVYPITPTENPRAELYSPPLVEPGEEVWLHTRFLIPADYPPVPEGGWVSLVSFYGAPYNGPSPWRLELCGEQLRWQRNGTYNWDVPYQAPLVRGQWTDVLVHEKFAADGFVEMWINGQQVSFFSSGGSNPARYAPTTQLAMATMDASNGAGANAAKIMQYREEGMFATGTVYFEGLELGPTRASVGA